MKTADEFIEDVNIDDIFDINEVRVLMITFAAETCIEQRKLCAKEVKDWELNLDNNDKYVEEAILKAILAVTP